MGLYSALDLSTSKVYVPKPRVFYVGGYQAWATAYKYDRWTGFETPKQAFDSILHSLSYEHRKNVIEQGTSVRTAPQLRQEQMNAIPTIGQYADYVTMGPLKTALDHEGPYFPQRRNWFQRLLDRF